jgi:hypothetical protein
MPVSASVTLNLGVIKLTLTQDELASLKKRFTRSPLYKGPCMILNRDTGLALDAGPDAKTGDHNVLWQSHAGPWQQWRLRGVGGGEIEILSESSGLRLTTMATGYDWGEVWLHRNQANDWSTRWRLKSTDDGVAFLIQNSASGYALDAGQNAENGRDPHVWQPHWAGWQQWIIVRLPLTQRLPSTAYFSCRLRSTVSPAIIMY